MSKSSVLRASFIATILAGFVLAALFSMPALAQDVATITGIVTDQSGALVPDAMVTLTNSQTGVVYTATSNSDGSYTITQVKPGPGYKMEFKHAGFKDTVISGLYLNVDATRTQNAQLSVGEARETVEVSAESQTVTLDTTDATVGNNFQVQMLQRSAGAGPKQSFGALCAAAWSHPGRCGDRCAHRSESRHGGWT